MDRHPIIEGLNAALPEPGAAWPKALRQLWLNAAAACFDLLYKDEEPERASPEPPRGREEAPPAADAKPRTPARRPKAPTSGRKRSPSPIEAEMEEMRALYEGGTPVAKIAKDIGRAESSVRRALQRAGVEFRGRSKPPDSEIDQAVARALM